MGQAILSVMKDGCLEGNLAQLLGGGMKRKRKVLSSVDRGSGAGRGLGFFTQLPLSTSYVLCQLILTKPVTWGISRTIFQRSKLRHRAVKPPCRRS